MNVIISKRLEQLEKRFSVRHIPNLILIEYEPEEGIYIVREQYCKFDGRGNVIKGGYKRNRKIKALEEYIIPADYTAQVIIDLIGAGGPITTVNIPELRKKANIDQTPFVFVSVSSKYEQEVTAEIALLESEVK